MSAKCEYEGPAAEPGHDAAATHMVALTIGGHTDLELWCGECVERVVYSLDDQATAARVVACRSVGVGEAE